MIRDAEQTIAVGLTNYALGRQLRMLADTMYSVAGRQTEAFLIEAAERLQATPEPGYAEFKTQTGIDLAQPIPHQTTPYPPGATPA